MPALYHAGAPGFSQPSRRNCSNCSCDGFSTSRFRQNCSSKKFQSALGRILAAGDGDDAGKIAFAEAPDHLRIRFRRNQNVAVSQEKRRVADEILRQFRRLARAVLHDLPSERDARAKFFAVAEMVFNHLGAPAGDDENLADARRDDAGDDVFEDGLALHAEHGFGQLIGEFPHARALAGGQNDGFHGRNLTTDLSSVAILRRRMNTDGSG